MKAARVNAFGGEDQLEIAEVPDPVAGDGEVLVRVKAGGLNYADVMQRLGLYPGGPKPPYIAGMEAAGIVESHGPGECAPVGSRVVALGRGAHAELMYQTRAPVLSYRKTCPSKRVRLFPFSI